MTNLFVDTDVLLDLITGRKPFSFDAAELFTLIQNNKIEAHVTSLSFSNLYYLLRKYASHKIVISKLEELSKLVSILKVDEKVVKESLLSRFKDFEDAIQCYSAQSHTSMDVLITRNIKDYKLARLPVMSPNTFLKTFQQKITLG